MVSFQAALLAEWFDHIAFRKFWRARQHDQSQRVPFTMPTSDLTEDPVALAVEGVQKVDRPAVWRPALAVFFAGSLFE